MRDLGEIAVRFRKSRRDFPRSRLSRQDLLGLGEIAVRPRKSRRDFPRSRRHLVYLAEISLISARYARSRRDLGKFGNLGAIVRDPGEISFISPRSRKIFHKGYATEITKRFNCFKLYFTFYSDVQANSPLHPLKARGILSLARAHNSWEGNGDYMEG